MQSKNKKAPTVAEADHIARVATLPCIVCEAPPPSEVHEPEQGLWWVSMPLCAECHRGPKGWHGTRLRWTLRKVSEMDAINRTIRGLLAYPLQPLRTAIPGVSAAARLGVPEAEPAGASQRARARRPAPDTDAPPEMAAAVVFDHHTRETQIKPILAADFYWSD